MSIRRPAVQLTLGALLTFALGSCAATPREPSMRPLPDDVDRFLLDPAPLAAQDGMATISEQFRRLRSGVSVSRLRGDLARLEAELAGEAAVAILAAQLEFVAGERDEASRLLGELPPEVRVSAPARLLEARLAELARAPLEAFLAYRELADGSPVAAEKRAELQEEAARELHRRIEDALAAGRVEAAAAELSRLETVDPRSPEALGLAARVARALGDRSRELSAVRGLAAARPADLELQIRRGELEAEVGDVAAGLALLERLASEHEANPRLAAALERVKFAYRVAHAPEPVRRIAGKPQLGRGDFARMLYWLVPAVRAARPGATRIASDLIDDPAREELVRVANLGLLRIDEALHRFEPERALTRFEAFAALARLAGEPSETPASACDFAWRSGWLGEAAECRPAAPVSGSEATGWLRGSVKEEERGEP